MRHVTRASAGALLAVTTIIPSFVIADVLGGNAETTLAREEALKPDDLGASEVDGLAYGDPTEALSLIDSPEPDSYGAAELSYPLIIPAGRGFTPNVDPSYSSSGGNGWLGIGWDVGVGEVAVDTTFGAPHFDSAKESESYTLDGDLLVPNATGDVWVDRVTGDRSDYTRQVETEYELITRHEVPPGGPANYFWEVRDKEGNVRWYGGFPDSGGPGPYGASDTVPSIDKSAIVFDDNGNAVRWLLSAQRDVGVNEVRYFYDTVYYRSNGNGAWIAQPDKATCELTSQVCGRHTYLDHIDYTKASSKVGYGADAPYRIQLIRDKVVNPGAPARLDPIVDASLGYVDVLPDRLGRIQVMYGPPSYGQEVVQYNFAYQPNTPYDKTLLASITQGTGADAVTHTFDYYDAVTTAGGGYDGFADPVEWTTADDQADKQYLDSSVSTGMLGSSESNGAEGHAYIGFNALIPQKVGSFGGSFQIGGSGTDALAEWIDLNGDNLPDKVFKDGGAIKFRLNQNGADGTGGFSGGAEPGNAPATNLGGLSHESSVNFQLSVEAYIVVTAAFGIGGQVSIGDSYFTDVNADGLPDFISGGQVYFNHLVGGVPTFSTDDSLTSVPLPVNTNSPTIASDQITDAQNDLAAQSPLVDTVRRWVAPYTGTVTIDGVVEFTPNVASPDGVRVAIQKNGDAELAAANLINDGAKAFESPITGVAVNAGDRLYFRVGSIDNGAGDEVSWAPTITYTSMPDGLPGADANGLSQNLFDADADFTVSGRPHSMVVMPFTGTVRVEATIDKAATSDDVELIVLYDGTPVPVQNSVVEAAFDSDGGPDTPRQLTVDFAVSGPVQAAVPTDSVQHTVEIYLATDSPVDLTAIDYSASLHYLSGVDDQGDPLVVEKNGQPTINVDFAPEIEQYPNSSPALPAVTATPGAGTFDALVSVTRLGGDGTSVATSEAIVTVKDVAGTIVAQAPVTLDFRVLPSQAVLANLDFAPNGSDEYFFDVTVRDPATAGAGLRLDGFALRPDGAADGTSDVDISAARLRWTGQQGIFPLAYRGWGIAGYTAPGVLATSAIVESAFTIDTTSADRDPANAPDGFEDLGSTSESGAEPSYAYAPRANSPVFPGAAAPLPGAIWRGTRDNLAGNATSMRSSRLGTDSVTLTGATGGGGRAVTRIGLTIPSLSLAFGIGPLAASLGFGSSFGLVDYEDLNGDGYPDVIQAGKVSYTDQRGAYLPEKSISQADVVNQDLTFAVQGGLTSGLVDIKGNSKGRTNATKGGAAGKGGDADDSGGGLSLGVSINASWTSPNASGGSDPAVVPGGTTNPSATYADQIAEAPEDSTGGTAAIQKSFADVNGDGLADRVYTTPEGVFAQYNLGYGFTGDVVHIANGGFESMESYAGGLSIGFTTPWAEFSGGVALNWSYDMARYTWRDVNGDGIPDQIHKTSNDPNVPPLVRFGTGSGLRPAVSYGDMQTGNALGGLQTGQHASFDQSNGLGGQFDFTIYVGPLCIVACYLIINPGASYQNSVSTTVVDLEDVNGDGAADALKTTDDRQLWVSLNNQGRTNLLHRVHNPLGGSFDLSYERDGNTTDHADSVWSMSRLDVYDGRPGDGADTQSTTFVYDGLKYDVPHRSSLGYSTITATELDTQNGNAPLRVTISSFSNDSVFDAGLPTGIELQDGAGHTLRRSSITWGFRDVRSVEPSFDPNAEVTLIAAGSLGDVHSVASRGRSIAPLLTRTDESFFDGSQVAQKSSAMTYAYDGLGNVLTQTDSGEPDDPNDNVVATYEYSTCDLSSSIGCATAAPAHPSPLWSMTQSCQTWVSLPAGLTVSNGFTGADEIVYRQRDGHPDLCDNASVTRLEETVDGGTTAVTELAYDDFGSYDRIVYPAGADGVRYAVQYTYDPGRYSAIAQVDEYDFEEADVAVFLDYDPATTPTPLRVGISSSATFDPLADRVKSRTDANGNVTTYTYDGLGRIESISSPVAGDPVALIEYEYAPSAGSYGYAIAHHFDYFADDPADTIDTIAFADGLGRITQTKRDARILDATGGTPVVGRTVSGATNYDALGRPVEQYLPTADAFALTSYDTSTPSGPVTKTMYNLFDKPTLVDEPADHDTTISYGFDAMQNGGPTLFKTTMTAANARATITYTDVRDNVRAVDDLPANAAKLRTAYDYDGMGQLLQVIDTSGNATTYSYDMMGNRLTTKTPDGGLVEFGYDAEGKLISKVTPKLLGAGTQISYGYELGHVVSIDYPAGTPDVAYTYGAPGAPNNGAGRVIREEDGSRIVTNEYAPSGALISQMAEMKTHGWYNVTDGDYSKFQWTTEWDYDGLGRLKSMVYPDGERLTYDYDAGGLLRTIDGEEDGFITVPVLDLNGVPVLDIFGNPTYAQVPHLWEYEYLRDRQYDVQLRRRFDEVGNGVTTALTFETDTGWLSRLQSFSPNRNTTDPVYQEVQDLNYTYDSVGNPMTYHNDVPAPVSNLISGAVAQTYTYDAYERLVGGTGTYELSDKRIRHYDFSITFDQHGNVTTKKQRDAIASGNKDLVQKDTTYDFSRSYTQSAPHQATSVGTDRYFYDANGNFLGIKDKRGKWIRQVTWDASDRMRTVTDGPQTTDYTYDDSGQRTIERGPAGETVFVNPWVTVRNTNEIYKHIWAGDNRIATQRDDGGNEELKRYFIHTDLQGSTNLVTDYRGDTFQHHEYFPTGEAWIDDHNTVFRTPYQYAGGYVDEVREIISIGARWYDQNREFFYSADPFLVDDGQALLADPKLAAAYSYAGANPVTNIDPSGRKFFTANGVDKAKASDKFFRTELAKNPSLQAAALEQLESQLPRALRGNAAKYLDQDAAKKISDRAEMLKANPLVEINLTKGTVKIGAPYGKRLKLEATKRAGADTAATGGNVGNGPTPKDTGAASTTGTPVASQQTPVARNNSAAAPDDPGAQPNDSGAGDAGGSGADDASRHTATQQAVAKGNDTNAGD